MEPRIFPLFASAALTFASLLGSAALSRAEVLVSEDFTYADGGLNGQTGGKGFSAAWAFSTNVTGASRLGTVLLPEALPPRFLLPEYSGCLSTGASLPTRILKLNLADSRF